MMAQPDITGLIGVWPSLEDELSVHEDASSGSSSATDYASSSGSDSGLPYQSVFSTGLMSLELTEANLE
jgi:hypothetical protein